MSSGKNAGGGSERRDSAPVARARAALISSPASAVARHNLAAALGDDGRWREAEPLVRSALAAGLDAPETWIVLARCLQTLRNFDEAEAAFLGAIKRRPAFADAHLELAQLRWMRTESADAALGELDAALVRAPDNARLNIVKGRALEFCGRLEDAFAHLRRFAERSPNDASAQIAASQAAAQLGLAAPALALARRAAGLASGDFAVGVTLCEALLAAGEAAEASRTAERLTQQAPDNQNAIALLATAWRLLDDARYGALYDYAAFVAPDRLDTPPGWPDLDAYLADLAEALIRVHGFETHPFSQSLRHGSQAPNLLEEPDPAIQAIPLAIEGAIRRRVAAIGTGPDPLRRRNRDGYAIDGMWSVKLRPGAGYHVDHVHPAGWLSSACYIDVPDRPAREGWIRFGKPGVKTAPPLEAEHYVRPEPGMLVLFPSYMWHGTEPFGGDRHRLTFAFDIVPA